MVKLDYFVKKKVLLPKLPWMMSNEEYKEYEEEKEEEEGPFYGWMKT